MEGTHDQPRPFSRTVKEGSAIFRIATYKKRVYRKAFPILMMRFLSYLVIADKPMSVKQISAEYSILRTFDESSHFPLLRLWGLVQKVGEKQYRATALAIQVLKLKEPVHSHIWTFEGQRVEPPRGYDENGKYFQESDGERLYINQIGHEKFNLSEVLDNAKQIHTPEDAPKIIDVEPQMPLIY